MSKDLKYVNSIGEFESQLLNPTNNQFDLKKKTEDQTKCANFKLKFTGFFFSILSSLTAVISNILIKKTVLING